MNRRATLFSWYLIITLFWIGLVLFYFNINEAAIKTLTLVVMGLLLLLTLLFFYLEYFQDYKKLERKLNHLEKSIVNTSLEQLKTDYLAVYNSYLHLSDRKKGPYYERLNGIRARLEEQLKLKKRLEQLVTGIESATLEGLKALEAELQSLLTRCSQPLQQEFSQHLFRLRERMEKGK